MHLTSIFIEKTPEGVTYENDSFPLFYLSGNNIKELKNMFFFLSVKKVTKVFIKTKKRSLHFNNIVIYKYICTSSVAEV